MLCKGSYDGGELVLLGTHGKVLAPNTAVYLRDVLTLHAVGRTHLVGRFARDGSAVTYDGGKPLVQPAVDISERASKLDVQR
jgi:hypothetical protein